MKKEDKLYSTPFEWLKNNRDKLGKYAGEWIAYTNKGVVFHNKDGKIVAKEARDSHLDYFLKYVHPLEIPHVVRIVPVHIRSLKNKK